MAKCSQRHISKWRSDQIWAALERVEKEISDLWHQQRVDQSKAELAAKALRVEMTEGLPPAPPRTW